MAYQAKSYGRVYHNLYHLVPLYKRAKKDVGKNQGFSQGRKERRPQAQLLDALEDLTGIRERVTVRHENRYERHSWAFYQLRIYIAYKAAWAGVPVRFVDPRNTSKTCSACGHCEKANRQSQSSFKCKQCGFCLNADINAAINISRAEVKRPMVATRKG
ncbi:MAG TPA: transposase [Ktedonobacteraceae bacterium]|nr:transposase [Ktedonobacteraceae bacterium]